MADEQFIHAPTIQGEARLLLPRFRLTAEGTVTRAIRRPTVPMTGGQFYEHQSTDDDLGWVVEAYPQDGLPRFGFGENRVDAWLALIDDLTRE
jgi:hypothetical protein